MRKLGVILELVKAHDKLWPTLKILGRDRVTIYSRASEAGRYQSAIDEAVRQGFEFILIDDDDRDYEKALGHDLYYVESSFLYDQGQEAPRSDNAMDVSYFHKNRDVLALKKRGKRFVCDTYSLELMPNEDFLQAGIFFLGACEEIMLRGLGRGELLCDAEGRPIMGISPQGGEIAAVGCPNATDERLAMSRRGKPELQAELAEKMGVRFDPDLPLILYMTTHLMESASINKGLNNLAQRANVVIKYRPPECAGFYKGFNGFFQAEDDRVFLAADHSLNWLMRQAADVTLVNPWGGGFYTNMMLGWRMILIHTSRCWDLKSNRPVSFTQILRDTGYLWVRAAYGLCPLHIESADMIMERVHDQAYWDRFDREFPALARSVLGRFWLGEAAARRAAMFIARVLERGTFKPAPEDMNGCRLIPGPLSNEFPTDICL